MMSEAQGDLAQELFEAFFRFRRLHWKHSPVAGLSPSEIRVLMHLRRMAAVEAAGAGPKVSEISGVLQVAPPTATQLISELESRGYVERAMDRDDRRAVRVTLTKKGALILVQVHDDLVTSFKGLVEYLGEEDSKHLVDLLTRMFTYFNEAKEANS
jgi:DNA-binding MarR family transcriptional regulator